VAAIALTAMLTGCGSGKLSSEADSRLAEAEQAVATYCLSQAEGGDNLDEYDAGQRGIDTLIEIYRQSPDADYDGRSVKQVAADVANQLDDGCDREAARKLDRALRAGA
jgi:hypothetical protein